MHHLQTGIEFALTVLPKSATFLQPGKRTFNYPSFGNNRKSRQVTALGYLYSRINNSLNFRGKGFSCIASIGQNIFNTLKTVHIAFYRQQGSRAIRNIGRRNLYGMRKPLGVDEDMPFDARNLFPRIIAFLFGRVRVLHALRVDDQKTCPGFAPLFGTGRANPLFLTRAPARFFPQHLEHSIAENRHIRCVILENHGGSFAIDTHF